MGYSSGGARAGKVYVSANKKYYVEKTAEGLVLISNDMNSPVKYDRVESVAVVSSIN
jgi:hypothetical protein